MAKKSSKTPAPAGPSQMPIPFNAIESALSEDKLLVRVIHFWEARNPTKGGLLIGLELHLIDEESTVIQGFIAPNRIGMFEGRLKANSIYSLTNFFATGNKNLYRVTDHKFTICFTDNSNLSEIVDQNVVIDTQRFRFHGFEELQSNCDRSGDLYNIIGHLKLINGQNLQEKPQIDIVGDSQKQRVSVHVQPKEGPVINIYLSKLPLISPICAFGDNCESQKDRRLGKACVASMSSSRVFFDTEVPPTTDYLTWLGTQGPSLATNDASQVVKAETLTISEILTFLKTQPPQKVIFNCVATIDHIKQEYGWHYIESPDCATKVTKGDSTLVCQKCNNPNAMGVIKFRLEYAVQDKETEATFVFLDDAAVELIGRQATELRDEHFEANGEMVQGEEVPLPDCLSEVSGQTHKFELKITEYNFRASRQTFTVTKLIKPEVADGDQHNILQEPGESSSTEPNGTSSTSNGETGFVVSETQSEKFPKETTEDSGQVQKRPRLNS